MDVKPRSITNLVLIENGKPAADFHLNPASEKMRSIPKVPTSMYNNRTPVKLADRG